MFDPNEMCEELLESLKAKGPNDELSPEEVLQALVRHRGVENCPGENDGDVKVLIDEIGRVTTANVRKWGLCE